MHFVNKTFLNTDRLRTLFQKYAEGWPHEPLRVQVRYTRSADFSGTCDYTNKRIFVNVGKHVTYPYAMNTYIARAQSNAMHWWKELYAIELEDPYQLSLFLFLHELYHWLIKRARRNTRQKESMCDRFATRTLVDDFGCVVLDEKGKPALREIWDFQDLDGFVAAARRTNASAKAARRPLSRPAPRPKPPESQFWLFPM